jgi:TM2 domain-containing membrane protein YozV
MNEPVDPYAGAHPVDPYAGAYPGGAYPEPAPTRAYGASPEYRPTSDKSRVTAGLLQLVPAILFATGGIGRLYAGQRGLGIAQLVMSGVGWLSFWCGFALFVPWLLFAAVWVWFVIDGIVLLAGNPVDEHGRPLRA